MFSLSLGILAALAWGLHDLTARIIAAKAPTFAIMFGTIGAGFLILTPFVLIFSDWHMPSGNGIYWAIGSGVAYVIGCYGLFRAFSLAPTWLVSPIACSYPLISLIFSFCAGRPVSRLEWLSACAVIVGILVIGLARETKYKTNAGFITRETMIKSTFWAFVGSVGFALTFYCGQNATQTSSALHMLWIGRATSVLVIFLILFLSGQELKPKGAKWPTFLAMGALDAAALSSVLVAGVLENAQYATIASSMFGVVTILLAHHFLKELLKPGQWLGIFIVFAGISILAS